MPGFGIRMEEKVYAENKRGECQKREKRWKKSYYSVKLNNGNEVYKLSKFAWIFALI